MARISSYPIDSTIQDKDSWIGTESTNRVTRNFTAEDIANYVVTSTSGVTGSGTFNTLPLWTPDGKTLGDSIIHQGASGERIGIGTTDPQRELDVFGGIRVRGPLDLFQQNNNSFAGQDAGNWEQRPGAEEGRSWRAPTREEPKFESVVELTRDAKNLEAGAEKVVDLGHPRVEQKIGVGRLCTGVSPSEG